MIDLNDKLPDSTATTSRLADRGHMVELDGPSIAAVAGGINPQPVPPGHSED
jgi:hypothetical protein